MYYEYVCTCARVCVCSKLLEGYVFISWSVLCRGIRSFVLNAFAFQEVLSQINAYMLATTNKVLE